MPSPCPWRALNARPLAFQHPCKVQTGICTRPILHGSAGKALLAALIPFQGQTKTLCHVLMYALALSVRQTGSQYRRPTKSGPLALQLKALHKGQLQKLFVRGSSRSSPSLLNRHFVHSFELVQSRSKGPLVWPLVPNPYKLITAPS